TVILREHKPEDRVVEREVHGLNMELARLRLSHPDSTALEATFRSLAARVTNPNLDVTRADGVAALDGDSLRFAFRHVSLPHTDAAAQGRVRWGRNRPWLEASVSARSFAFEDVHALIPIPLPHTGGGRVSVRLRLGPEKRNEFDIAQSDITTGRSHFT